MLESASLTLVRVFKPPSIFSSTYMCSQCDPKPQGNLSLLMFTRHTWPSAAPTLCACLSPLVPSHDVFAVRA